MRVAFKSPWLCALSGVIIAAAIYTHYVFYDFTKPVNTVDMTVGIVEIVLCPTSLLSLLCIDCEVGTSAGLQIWAVIALLNGGLYWLLASAVVKRQRVASVIHPDASPTNEHRF
jgi:hypothetical protein